MPYQRIIFLLILLFCALSASAQEICDNGIDDDNDGLVDLNDQDCICLANVPSSLIPNPSFEAYTYCPFRPNQLDAAVDWIQASRATTDFIHTCGNFLGNPGANGAKAPLPLPDGSGAIGFRDGNTARPNFKEYVGADLTAPMQPGVTYLLDFFVGFHDHPSSRNFPMAIFLAEDERSLPFGGNSSLFGCPTNGPGWDLLAEKEIQGDNEWINVTFEFVADKAYEAIALGPGCEQHPQWRDEPYFFMDRLVLIEVSEALVDLEVSGNYCSNNLQYSTAEISPSYQWYHEGVALVGETGQFLDLDNNAAEGNYRVVIQNDEGCFLSEEVELIDPERGGMVQQEICMGETYFFGGREIASSGVYMDTTQVGLLCDSITILDLVVLEPVTEFQEVFVCPGETYELGGTEIALPGIYNQVTDSSGVCDQILELQVIFVDEIGFLELPAVVELNLGESLEIFPEVSPDVVSYAWSVDDRILSEDRTLTELVLVEDTQVVLEVRNAFGCAQQRTAEILIDKSVNMYTPNIISLSASGNDEFLIGTNLAVEMINFLGIYDRWGNLVYEYSGPAEAYRGWNGRRSNGEYEQGVYTYVLDLGILDGSSDLTAGQILLLR